MRIASSDLSCAKLRLNFACMLLLFSGEDLIYTTIKVKKQVLNISEINVKANSAQLSSNLG
jgi:hypothetical protein